MYMLTLILVPHCVDLKLCETTASTKIYQSKCGGHGFHSHFYSSKKYTYLVPLLPFCEHLQIYPNQMCTTLLYISEHVVFSERCILLWDQNF